MKNVDPKILAVIAKKYGKNFAGDEANPSESEVPYANATPEEISNYNTDQLLSSAEARLAPGYDGSPDANPNVKISDSTLAQANIQPGEDLNVPAAPNAGVESVSGSQPNVAEKAPDVQSDFQKAGVPDVEQTLKEQKTANTKEAEAQAKQGAEEVAALQDANNALAALPSANDIFKSYKEKDDQLAKAYESKQLDPNKYLNSISTGQKITTGIGLIIGAFGGTKTAEFAAKMIKANIDRDIDAQKNDQTQSMNLWKMNREEYGNEQAANLATENQILTGVKTQLMQAASNAKGPLAKANAEKANALIDGQMAQNRFKLSLMQPTSDSNPNSPAGMDPAKKVTWLVPEAKQQKVFDEIEAAQNTTRNAQGIVDSFDQAALEARPVSAIASGRAPSLTAFVPGMDSAHQKSLHVLLGPTFQDVEGTVRQAAMDNMFKNTTPQFGDSDQTIATKREALIHYLTSKTAAPTASGFGINLKDYPSTNSAGVIAAKQSPQEKQKIAAGPEIRMDAQGNKWTRNEKGQVVPYNPTKAMAGR